MPLTFPSHQGLIVPLSRRWPGHFDGLALCVGAAMPDVVDGILGLCRGHLGQWYGHTLVGTIVLCWPGGLLLTWVLTVLAARLSRRSGFVRSLQAVLARSVRSPGSDAATGGAGGVRGGFVLVSLSIWAGALSHLVWDFVSHGNCLWLYPWYPNSQVFPSWWYAAWYEIPMPLYHRYPLGPHLVVWVALSIVGAWLFFRPALRRF